MLHGISHAPQQVRVFLLMQNKLKHFFQVCTAQKHPQESEIFSMFFYITIKTKIRPGRPIAIGAAKQRSIQSFRDARGHLCSRSRLSQNRGQGAIILIKPNKPAGTLDLYQLTAGDKIDRRFFKMFHSAFLYVVASHLY